MTRTSALSVAVIGLLLTTHARADAGVVEINHACASGPGCFAGDAPGYPVEISGAAGHAYRLTSDLVLANPALYDANSSAIAISGDRVSVDLAGFQVLGPCLSSCASGGGTGEGVAAAAFSEGVEIRNGSVVGMGGNGVGLGTAGSARDLRVQSNRGAGIVGGAGAHVAACVSERNGFDGISVGEGGIVRDSSARLNGGTGIAGGFDATVRGSASLSNALDGIRTGGGGRVEGNTAASNAGNGIVGGAGTLVRGNTARANGTGSTGDGIQAEAGSAVKDNAVRFNHGFGLRLTFPAGYSGNQITGNTAGTVSGGPDLGGNYCDSPTGSCP